jgi:hypothetical protein
MRPVRRWLSGLALLVAVLGGAWAPETWGSAIDRSGMWTLDRLGFDDRPLPVPYVASTSNSRVRSRRFDYFLPKQVVTRPGLSYSMRLHFRVELAANTSPGRLYVIGHTNGYESVLVECTIAGPPGNRTIGWSTSDWLSGLKRGRTTSRVLTLDTANFLQTSGTRVGRNALGVRVEEFGNVRVNAFHVFPDSGIRLDHREPAQLHLTVRSAPQEIRVGHRVALNFSVRNTGDYPARQVRVAAVTDGQVAEPAKPAVVNLDRVVSEAAGTVWVRAIRAGHGDVGIRVTGPSNLSRTSVARMSVGQADVPVWRRLGAKLIVFVVFVPTLAVLFGGRALERIRARG